VSGKNGTGKYFQYWDWGFEMGAWICLGGFSLRFGQIKHQCAISPTFSFVPFITCAISTCAICS